MVRRLSRRMIGARIIVAGAVVTGGIGLAAALNAQARPVFEKDGTVIVPSFSLPPSEFISDVARAEQQRRAAMPTMMPTTQNPDIATRRRQVDAAMAPRVALMRKTFAVDVAESRIAGIPVRIVTPKDGKVDGKRVLINLHGGGFTLCWDSCSLLESIPIAALGGYKVVSVNYRMGPEAKHPAGIEDATAVYRDLLKTYDPKRIGIYGCSAGGALTAQTAAWLPAHGLPQAGAVGIFGAGGVRMSAGDSAWIAAYIDGSFPPPATGDKRMADMTRGYFADVDMADASVSPALHPDVMKTFPPALFITGTRSMDMSPAIVTNSRLLKAGVKSTLIVGEGMGHCYIYQAELPEARDAYDATVAFFRENLR